MSWDFGPGPCGEVGIDPGKVSDEYDLPAQEYPKKITATATTPDCLPTTKLALNELILAPGYLGPYPVGMGFPTATPANDPIKYSPKFCQEGYKNGSFAGPGAWVANYPPASATAVYKWGPRITPFVPVVDRRNGIMHAVIVTAPGPHTASGIQVGSSRAALKKAYPKAELHADPAYGDVYSVREGNLTIWFEVWNGSNETAAELTHDWGFPDLKFWNGNPRGKVVSITVGNAPNGENWGGPIYIPTHSSDSTCSEA